MVKVVAICFLSYIHLPYVLKGVIGLSIERVKEYLRKWDREQDVMEFTTSSATVAEAAEAVGTEPSHIAKSLSFMGSDGNGLLVVTAGDRKIDNKKFKQKFETKARMLAPDQVEEQTGFKIGGVCPFALINPLPVYLDESMKRFDYIYPACGSSNSAIKLTTDELFEYAYALDWVDVCKSV